MKPHAVTPPDLPATGYMREAQIIGRRPVTPEEAEANKKLGKGLKRPRAGIEPIIPVSAMTWWRWVKHGIAPKPCKLSGGVTAWRVEDIRSFLASQSAA